MRILIALAITVLAGVAHGQQSDQQLCDGTSGTAEERIAACTRRITSGNLSREDLAITFYNRGIEWNGLREYERAISDYSEALSANPQYASAYYNRGIVWFAKRDYDRAISDYSEAIRINPQHSSAYVNRGNTWRTKGDVERAMADFNEAIRLNPREAVAFRNRGLIWNDRKDYDRAIAEYSEAIRVNPQYSAAYNSRGFAWYAKNDYDRAIADYSDAIRLDPQMTVAYVNRGNAFAGKGEITRALADYESAVQLEPNNAARYNSIAWRLAVSRNDKGRDGRRAVQYATKACELTSWNEANYIDTLAAAYAESGQFAEAVRWQEKALENATFANLNGDAARARLELYRGKKPYRE